MRYEEVMTALMYVDMLKSKEGARLLPQELQDNKDLILYADSAISLKQGDYNYHYPLLKQGLNKQFNLYVRDEWVKIVNKEPFETILDVGAGNGAYLNALTQFGNILFLSACCLPHLLLDLSNVWNMDLGQRQG